MRTFSRTARRKVSTVAVVLGTLAALAVPAPAGAADGFGPQDWPMYNYDQKGTRHNTVENTLTRTSAAGLHQAWRLETDAGQQVGAVFGTPIVVNNVLYAGDGKGVFRAVNATNGTVLWRWTAPAPIWASAMVVGEVVTFGDQAGNIHGLNRTTGAVLWSIKPNNHPTAAIYSSGTYIDKNKVIFGISSNEPVIAGDLNYPCCSFRGSVVALNPQTGAILWNAPTLTDADVVTEQGLPASQAAGASVWSTVTYDKGSDTVFFGTSNDYTKPNSHTSDSVFALNANTGQRRWVTQLTANDTWNFRYLGHPDYLDYDIGDSPQIFRQANGRKVIAAGQKSGFMHVLDAATGEPLRNYQATPGGELGGLFADSALASGTTYANAIDWPDYPSGTGSGSLVAMNTDRVAGITELWRVETPNSPNWGGVSVARGVVYFASNGSADQSTQGALYAVNASTGAVIKKVDLGAGSASGPSISRGRVFVGIGLLFDAGGSGGIVALAP